MRTTTATEMDVRGPRPGGAFARHGACSCKFCWQQTRYRKHSIECDTRLRLGPVMCCVARHDGTREQIPLDPRRIADVDPFWRTMWRGRGRRYLTSVKRRNGDIKSAILEVVKNDPAMQGRLDQSAARVLARAMRQEERSCRGFRKFGCWPRRWVRNDRVRSLAKSFARRMSWILRVALWISRS